MFDEFKIWWKNNISSVPKRQEKPPCYSTYSHIFTVGWLMPSCIGCGGMGGWEKKGVSQEVKRDEEIFYARFRVLGAGADGEWQLDWGWVEQATTEEGRITNVYVRIFSAFIIKITSKIWIYLYFRLSHATPPNPGLLRRNAMLKEVDETKLRIWVEQMEDRKGMLYTAGI